MIDFKNVEKKHYNIKMDYRIFKNRCENTYQEIFKVGFGLNSNN